MFTADFRERLRDALIARARADKRVVAAAAVGGSAGESDRWSDLDLTFGVAEELSVEVVLRDWTEHMIEEYQAAVLFDLPRGSSIYRVFLLPGMLQADLSFTPAPEFGARGPRFNLLFGEAIEHPPVPAEPSQQLFGLAAHHLVRATVCIERGHLWQAELWIHLARDDVLTLACRRFGLSEDYGRGFDQLPVEVRTPLLDGLVGSLQPSELRRAIAAVFRGLIREGEGLPTTLDVKRIFGSAERHVYS